MVSSITGNLKSGAARLRQFGAKISIWTPTSLPKVVLQPTFGQKGHGNLAKLVLTRICSIILVRADRKPDSHFPGYE